MHLFKRKISESLLKWKASVRRKPLILRGARQVGKSFVIREFGKTHYQKLIEINFEKTPAIKSIFEKDLDPHRILAELELFLNRKILPKIHLLFLDIARKKRLTAGRQPPATNKNANRQN